MDRTLLLNTTFEPISVLSWKKAVTLIYLGKVEVLKEYDREIRGVSISIRQPAVIRLLTLVRSNHAKVKFSRRNVFLRDDHTCQYCGEKLEAKHLTCDHLDPEITRRGYGMDQYCHVMHHMQPEKRRQAA